MRDKFRRFMYGRYGLDSLGKCMIWAAVVCALLRYVTHIRILNAGLSVLCWTLIFVAYYRIFSKKTYLRALENQKFYQKTAKIRTFINNKKTQFSQRKTHAFFNCPTCKQTIRVPKGKGNIEITCPKCKNKFVKRT